MYFTFDGVDDFGVELLVLELALGGEGGSSQGLAVPEGIHQLARQLRPVLGLPASLLKPGQSHVDPRASDQLHTVLRGRAQLRLGILRVVCAVSQLVVYIQTSVRGEGERAREGGREETK